MTQHDKIVIVPWDDGRRIRRITEVGFIEYEVPPLRAIYWTDPLPPGDWHIVGRLFDLTEEECRLLCPPLPSGVRWPNYEHPERLLLTAKDGFYSFLRSIGIDPESNPLILKREGV